MRRRGSSSVPLPDDDLYPSVLRIVASLPGSEGMRTRAHASLVAVGVELHRNLPAKDVHMLLLDVWVDLAENWGGDVHG